MNDFNNNDRGFNQGRRMDNPYTKYDRAPGETRGGYIDPSKPLQPQMQQQGYYGPQQRPTYTQQQLPPQQMNPQFIPQLPQNVINPPPQPQPIPLQQMMAPYQSPSEYEEQFNYNQQAQYQQQRVQHKKKGFFASIFGQKEEPQPQNYYSKNVIIQTPVAIDDIKVIINMLKGGNTVIVDYSKVNGNDCQRMIDYLAGALYALVGVHRHIGGKRFIYTPSGTGITGQIEDDKK